MFEKRIDNDRLVGNQSASKRAAYLFQSDDDLPENISPTLLIVNDLEIWRALHLFIEGGCDMRLVSTAFVQAQGRSDRLQL